MVSFCQPKEVVNPCEGFWRFGKPRVENSAASINLIMLNWAQKGKTYSPEVQQLRINVDNGVKELGPCYDTDPEAFDNAIQGLKQALGTKNMYSMAYGQGLHRGACRQHQGNHQEPTR